MRWPAASARVEAGIAALPSLPRAELLERWAAYYGSPPPKGSSKALLVRAIAYAIQAKQYGGLKPATARRLSRLSGGSQSDPEIRANSVPRLQPGARLVREWNGATHVVEVEDGGFVWNGRRHRSLSAVARAITGARWSGPRFFGLSSEGAP